MSSLLKAARNGDVATIRTLLQQGKYPVDYKEEYSWASSLHYACEEGHLNVVEVLVSEFNADLSMKDIKGFTPLFYACSGRQLHVIRVLVFEYKADLTTKDYYGRTPLLFACERGDLEVIRTLLSEFNADLTVKDCYDRTPLLCACEKGYLDVIRVLVSEFKADLTSKNLCGRTPLLFACEKGNLDVIKVLVTEYEADLGIRDGAGNTAVMLAARWGHKNVVLTLLRDYHCPVNDIDNDGWGVLHYACARMDVSMVRILIRDYKADVTLKNKKNATPLQVAINDGKLDVAFCLICEFSCDPNVANKQGQTPLHYACKKGDLELVRVLVHEHKADVNFRNNAKETPLKVAISHKNFDVAFFLIREFGCNPNVAGQDGQTPLHYACERGDLDLVRALVHDCKADVNTHSLHSKLTPLEVALHHKNYDIAFCLIREFGCDPNMANQFGGTPLHYACKRGDVALVRTLIRDHRANVEACTIHQQTPLEVAFHYNKCDVIACLISEFGCDPNRANLQGQTPLHYACERGDLDLVRVLVHDCKADVNTPCLHSKLTPLEVALHHKKLDFAFCLIREFGCDPNVANQFGGTPLHYACKRGDVALVRALVRDHRANVEACTIHNRQTPLEVALSHDRFDVVACLITEFGCDPNRSNLQGQTPLHYACERGDLEFVSALVLDYKANIDACNKQLNTPIHVAAEKGQSEVVLALIELGCNPNVVNRQGQSLLHLVCKRGDVNLVHTLVGELKADPIAHNKHGDTPLHVAADAGQNEIVVALVSEYGCDPNTQGYLGMTPLHHASKRSNVDLVHALVCELKADVNACADGGDTPLHTAVVYGHHEMVLTLVNDYGCDPNIQGYLGRTPLHVASQQGYINMVQALLKLTTPLMADKNGDTPLHLAAEMEQVYSVQFLLNANAPVLVRNNNGQTALDVAKRVSKTYLDNYVNVNKQQMLTDYESMSEHAKKIYSGSHFITRVFVIGNPGAGKSSLIESLKRESFFQSLNKVSESSVPPHTAGIIPSIHTSKQYGRVLFYDFAGDAEYYSSHAAIFESLASSKKGNNIFIIVVDLRDDATMEVTLHYWFTFIDYQKFSKASFIVVGSHLDQSDKRSGCLDQFCASMRPNVHNITHFTLDCRDPRSNQIAQFKKQISAWVGESQKYEISSKARLLLGLLEKDFSAVTACPVQTLVSHIKDSGVWLPVEPKPLHKILLELHEVGVILLLGDCTKDTDHVILSTLKLTNEVHELLFSKSALQNIKKMRTGLKNSPFNIGIFPKEVLEELLPPYITIECLIHLQYCQQISHDNVGFFPCLGKAGRTGSSFIFFPALCNVDKSEMSWDVSTDSSFSIGWLALCTRPHDYFLPRFLHVLLLRLVYGFTLSPALLQTAHASPEHSRRCTMWKKGVHWKMEEGVHCMVEMVNGSKGVVVYSKSSMDVAEDCTRVFTKVVSCVMEAKAEFCHSAKTEYFLLDSSAEANCFNEDHLFAVSDVERALENPEGKRVILSVSGRGEMELSKLQCMRKFTHWDDLFPFDLSTVLHVLRTIVKRLHELVQILGVPHHILEAKEADFPYDVSRRRRELVRWWMNSSRDPPCWWHLVQALRKMEENVLAETIHQEHDLEIQLQEKMLCDETQAQKPNMEFLYSLSCVVGSRWPSLAVSLALKEGEIKELKGKVKLSQQVLALQVLKIWASGIDASYGQLCHKLKTISLFQYPFNEVDTH